MSEKKRILIFATAYYPYFSGAEVAVREITDRVTPYEYDLITARFSRKLPRRETIGRVVVHRIGFGTTFDKFLLPFWGLYKAIALQRKNNYQAIWSLMASQASIAAAWFSYIYRRVPLVVTLQEGDEESYLKRYVGGSDVLYKIIIAPLHHAVMKRAAQGVVISSYLAERLRSVNARIPITIIPNGVAFDNFKPTDRQSARQKLAALLQTNFADDIKIIIHHGRVVEKNALDDIVRALPLLPPKYVFVSIGSGDEVALLRSTAEELGVSGRVHILDTTMPQEEIGRLLSAGDVFCRPSVSEGLGNSFLEAMACRVPVIGTPVGGIVDFLVDTDDLTRVTGLNCGVHDHESIARAIIRYDQDEELRRAVIQNAEKMVQQNYTWEHIAAAMQHVFDSV